MDADNETASAATNELDQAANVIRAALSGDVASGLADLLDPSVTWGECAGAEAVLEFVSATVNAGADIRDLDVEVVGDRIVVEFRIGDEDFTITHAVFIRSGRITEIVHATDSESARTVRPVGDLARAAARPWRAKGCSPVLPVSDINRAIDHYRKLGFDVQAYEGDAPYAFAVRNSIELHLSQIRDLDAATNTSVYYLYVDDADALYATWRLAEIDGRLFAPFDTEYGLREGTHVDPDGNLVRFGSPL